MWMAFIGLVAVLAVGGCDTVGGGSDSSSSSSGSVKILTVSGSHLKMTGSWTACYKPSNDYSSSDDASETFAVDGDSVSRTVSTHTTSDGSCDGTATEVSGEAIDLTVDSTEDVTMKGWEKNGSMVSNPTAADGSTALADPPDATVMNVTLDDGSTSDLAWLVDDTVTPNEVYRDAYNNAAGCESPSGADRGGCLTLLDMLTQE